MLFPMSLESSRISSPRSPTNFHARYATDTHSIYSGVLLCEALTVSLSGQTDSRSRTVPRVSFDPFRARHRALQDCTQGSVQDEPFKSFSRGTEVSRLWIGETVSPGIFFRIQVAWPAEFCHVPIKVEILLVTRWLFKHVRLSQHNMVDHTKRHRSILGVHHGV